MAELSTSTMFLNQISVVDHAYIDDTGAVIGGSFNPDFLVSGDIDPVEKVVVDFSTIKKDIKKIIDAKEDGFDHKLWLIVGYSNAFAIDTEDGYYEVLTPKLVLRLPKNAVKVFEAHEYSSETTGYAIGQWVEDKLREQYPTIRVECINNVEAHTSHYTYGNNDKAQPSFFTYVHGLKDSTSWGCQNIAHGHLSFIQLYPVSVEGLRLQQKIASDLDGTIFIRKENIKQIDETGVAIEYTTDRGTFSAAYDTEELPVVILETETTIEFLAAYIRDRYKPELEAAKVHKLFVSEGLSKGAVETV